MDVDRTGSDRRTFVAAMAALCLVPISRDARAEGTATTRAGAWILGDNLSLSGLLYAQGNAERMSNTLFAKSERIATALGLTIKPFPPKAKTSSATFADVIHYLIKGDGALLGAALARKYDKDHALLYEVSIKSNLLILLYTPGNDSGIGKVIESRCSELKLPKPLWSGVVEAINSKQKASDVKDLVFKMHKEVGKYLISS